MRTAPERSGDPLFGVVAGLYAALLVSPPVVLAVARLLTTDGGVLYGTLVATVAVVTSLGWLASERAGRGPVALGATRLRWALGIVPIGYALLGFASLGETGVVGLVGFFFGTAAMAVGFLVGVMARTRYTSAVLDGAETDCELRAGWPAAARRKMGYLTGGSIVVAGACFAAGLLTDRLMLQTVGQVLFPVGIVLFTGTEPQRYAVTALGVEYRAPVARRLVRWEAFDGYTRTDDALVLHRPWRIDTRLALADLDDPDAVEAALARYLPPA